jgi:hypothetical protein
MSAKGIVLDTRYAGNPIVLAFLYVIWALLGGLNPRSYLGIYIRRIYIIHTHEITP